MKPEKMSNSKPGMADKISPKVIPENSPAYLSKKELPKEHYETVKVWLEATIGRTVQFTQNLDMKFKKNKDSRVFKPKRKFDVDDINKIFKNLYKSIDSSVNELQELKRNIDEYIGTWKDLAKGTNHVGESMKVAESVECTSPPLVTVVDDDVSKDSSELEENQPKIRVRNLSELMMKPEKSDASKVLTKKIEKDKSDSSSEECVILSDSPLKPKEPSKNKKNSEKLFSSSEEDIAPKKKGSSQKKLVLISSSSDTDDSDIRIILDEVSQKRALNQNVVKKEKLAPKVEKTTPEGKKKNATGVINSMRKDEKDIKKRDNLPDLCLFEEPNDKPVKSKMSINWDTSSSESERDWIVSSKSLKSKRNSRNDVKSLRNLRRRKSPSSEEELAKLCNIRGLSSKRRRKSTSYSDSDDSDVDTKKSKNKKIKKDKKNQEKEKEMDSDDKENIYESSKSNKKLKKNKSDDEKVSESENDLGKKKKSREEKESESEKEPDSEKELDSEKQSSKRKADKAEATDSHNDSDSEKKLAEKKKNDITTVYDSDKDSDSENGSSKKKNSDEAKDLDSNSENGSSKKKNSDKAKDKDSDRKKSDKTKDKDSDRKKSDKTKKYGSDKDSDCENECLKEKNDLAAASDIGKDARSEKECDQRNIDELRVFDSEEDSDSGKDSPKKEKLKKLKASDGKKDSESESGKKKKSDAAKESESEKDSESESGKKKKSDTAKESESEKDSESEFGKKKKYEKGKGSDCENNSESESEKEKKSNKGKGSGSEKDSESEKESGEKKKSDKARAAGKKKNSDTIESDEDTKDKKEKSSKKTKGGKDKKKQPTVMEFMDSSGSEMSEMDFNYDRWIHGLNMEERKMEKEYMPKIEEFGKILPESDVEVLTDSSLDSIAKILERSHQKVKRGRSSGPRKGGEGSKKKTDEGEKKRSLPSRPRFRDKLLEGKLTDTDTSEGEDNWEAHKMKTRLNSSESSGDEAEDPTTPTKDETATKKKSKRGKRQKNIFSDDSDVANIDQSTEDEEEKDKSENDDDKMDEDDEEEEGKKKVNKKKRKRIQRNTDSSEDDGEPTPSKSDGGKGRRNIRKVLKEDSLEKTTKEALKEEEERKQRIADKQKLYNELLCKAAEGLKKVQEVKVLEELVLDYDLEKKEPLVFVDTDLVKKLKPHQADGVKFMWDSCFESVKEASKSSGSGCILAHCMGLGKTLQVITLVHTLLTCERVEVNRVLVVAPFSTVQNWVNEFKKWLKDVGSGEDFEVYHMLKTAANFRQYQLRDWERTGGVMILGYNLFRSLVSPKGRVKASLKKTIAEVLLDPGPDVVICDEGHILKNEKTAVNIAMSKLKTRRRIVLTGTPLQNNLIEYHCMVQFVKPNLLGTRKEFQNRFVHPIQNGQFEDSTAHDVKIMKRRAHVLHKMLDGIVQRKDYNVLTPYLPPKYEYVIHVKLTDVQVKLYSHYLEVFARKSKNEGGGLFQDFQHLMRICTHPRSLLIHSDKEILKKELMDDDSEGSLKEFIDDGSESDESSAKSTSSKSSSSHSGSDRSKSPAKKRGTRTTRASGFVSDDEEQQVPLKRTEWWSDMVTEEELTDIKSSSKLFLFFTILKHCEEMGDKLLVFSQSLYTLDLIEHFLQLVDDNARKSETEQTPSLTQFSSNWDKGIDYFRLDGGTTSDNRANWCKVFNSPKNTRGRLFLISTRAGGLGINLTGANRVIIFDASWNPSFDVQSIFRVYRFGQTKPCFIYRFLAKGTMEEKIYERQVAKLSTSLRVIDEQQIDRHFTQTSLAELYAFNPEAPEDRETPALPKDRLMAELLQSFPEIILAHHQHDSLLENMENEELNEEERKAAWADFENEKNNVPPPNPFMGQQMGAGGFMNSNVSFNLQTQVIIESLIRKIKAQNPTLNEELVKQRAVETLQQMPFFKNQQQLLMNNYIQQQQQQFFQQQQYMQQQQLMQAQIQARQRLMQQQQQIGTAAGATPSVLGNLLASKTPNPADLISMAMKNGAPQHQGLKGGVNQAKAGTATAPGGSNPAKPPPPAKETLINLDD